MEPMTVRVEIYPLAADEGGLWSLGGLRTVTPELVVMADSEPHAEVELAMARFGLTTDDVVALHSTSWRAEGTSVVLTYMAVVNLDRPARERFPQALPVTLEASGKAGKPIPHHPAEAPTPRYIDVLLHGIRHLHWLIEHDAPFAAVLNDHWRRALAPLKDLLAGLYSDPYEDLDPVNDRVANIVAPNRQVAA